MSHRARPLALTSFIALGSFATACGAERDPGDRPSAAAGSAGASTGGASGASGTGAPAGAAACPDFMGAPVVGPGPGGGCHDGVCMSCILPIDGMSFASGTFTTTDNSTGTTTSVRTEPGVVCMSGSSAEYAILRLAVGRPDTIVAADGSKGKPFDAAALGITELEFTIETPPSAGLFPAVLTESPEMEPVEFALQSNGQDRSISSTASVRVALSDYGRPEAPATNRLLAFEFIVGAAAHYDFCIRSLKFFDANDVEVLPPR